MTIYIDMDVARRIINSPRSKEQMLLVLSQVEPADVFEVVRCKDCKWHGYLTCSNPEGIKGWVTDNDFCSYVERKGNFELPNIEELIS